MTPAELCVRKRRTCAYQGVRNVRFSENLACFVFSKHLFWHLPFCLIIDALSQDYPGKKAQTINS